jgi:hypothetical protein
MASTLIKTLAKKFDISYDEAVRIYNQVLKMPDINQEEIIAITILRLKKLKRSKK